MKNNPGRTPGSEIDMNQIEVKEKNLTMLSKIPTMNFSKC